MKNTDTRNFDLDLLRFLAALSVVLFHYTFRGYSADGMSIVGFQEISSITKYGYLGVNIFFMISGFVILMSAYFNTTGKFLISRFTRLYPTFWFAVLLTSILSYLIGTEKFQPSISQVFLNFTMLPTLFGEKNVDGIYWTLLIELKFYMLISFLLLFRFINYVKYFSFFWIVWSLFSFFYHTPDRINILLFPNFSSYFIAGAMFFLIKQEGFSFSKLSILLLSFVSSILYEIRHIKSQAEHFNSDFSIPVVTVIILIFYGIFYLISIEKKIFFNSKIFYYLGALTYPSYLIHQNIGYMFFNYYGHAVNKYLMLLLIMTGVFLIAYFMHLFIEKKLSAMLKKVLIKVFSNVKE